MITSKHIEKIVAVIVAAAVALCMLASIFSDTLIEKFGGFGITQEYESELFDISEIMSIDILMDEEEWNEMLENAIAEEYYPCDVVINNTTFYNVAIRPKGNTSLSTIANDPTTNRYSFKLEFDYYVDGQTCFGLDKLILNNNYADATNMKEAVVYDMFAYLGADASLWNYADISVNGETWGVYLALEAVEDSFMLRNYGTSSGELYKPDSMNMGGAGGMKDMDSEELQKIAEQFFGLSEETTEAQTSAQIQSGSKSSFISLSTGQRPAMNGQMPPDMGGMPNMGEMPDMGQMQPPQMGETPDMGQMPPEMNQSEGTTAASATESAQPENSEAASPEEEATVPSETPGIGNRPDMGNMPDIGGGRGGFGSGSGAALNYIDDNLESYSTIWDGEVTSSGNNDHRRVVEALKNISEQNNIEEYLDVDNMIKYMAVHTFVVNLDSLSGSMTHNYYLYEEDGMLNLVPWDYNLAFGGFSQGRSGSGATSTVNFPIDTPFSSGISLEDRQIFAAILENEEYLERYHEYLQSLCDEYVNGGRLKNLYNTVRSNIDDLVANDPNAFYPYDEYDTAAQTLLEVVSLRAESVSGQLEGTIPSTNDGQNESSDSLIDASDIDLSVLGTMNMGGGGTEPGNRGNRFSPDQTNSEESAEGGNPISPDMPEAADGNLPSSESPQSNRGFNGFPQGMTPPDGFDNSGNADSSESQGDLSSLPEGSEESVKQRFEMPQQSFDASSLIRLGICLAVMIAGIIIAKLIYRKNKI